MQFINIKYIPPMVRNIIVQVSWTELHTLMRFFFFLLYDVSDTIWILLQLRVLVMNVVGLLWCIFLAKKREKLEASKRMKP